MKILLASGPFHPSVGGVETVSKLLIESLSRLGHQVKVVTSRGDEVGALVDLSVIRRPSPLMLLKLYFWCDGMIIMGDNIRLGWPALLGVKKYMIVHHMCDMGNRMKGLGGLMRKLLRLSAINAAPSHAVESSLDVPCWIIPNPYNDEVFISDSAESVARDKDIIFVGRIIEEKGLLELFQAFDILNKRGLNLCMTIVGDGPLRGGLEYYAEKYGGRVRFSGIKKGGELAQLLNEHRVIVIPSVCDEAFGVVALEGIACGCVAVGTRSGGLVEAIGDCGVIVDKNAPLQMADQISNLVSDVQLRLKLQSRAPAHLARHTPAEVARKYLSMLN